MFSRKVDNGVVRFMIQIDPNDPAKTIIPFVLDWFALFADGKSEEACQALDEPNSYGKVWTTESINAVIVDTFGELYEPRISNPNELSPVRICPPEQFDDESGYFFDHAVPLNGEWSDLTAQFEFVKRANGFAVILHDLHVL